MARDLWRSLKPKPPGVDAYFISFPQCGRTWLELRIGMSLMRASGHPIESARRDLYALANEYNLSLRVHACHDWSETTLEAREAVNPQFLFASDLRMKYWGKVVFMLVRDPRDTIVSSYYQVTTRAFRPLPFNSIDEYVLDPVYGINRIIQFYRIWDRNAKHTTFAFERYESLRANTEHVLRRIISFLGVPEAENMRLDDIIEACSFDRFRKLEQSGREDMRQFGGTSMSMKARKGSIGGYREELRPETVAILDSVMSAMPPRFGFSVSD